MTPCKKPCRSCPFRRDSTPGWLGESSYDPWDFLASFNHGETPLPCHTKVNWESDRAQELAAIAPVCFGSLTMLKNEYKLPRSPEMTELVSSMVRNTQEFFAHHGEFMKHHLPL